jgi:hypothetical protein
VNIQQRQIFLIRKNLLPRHGQMDGRMFDRCGIPGVRLVPIDVEQESESSWGLCARWAEIVPATMTPVSRISVDF